MLVSRDHVDSLAKTCKTLMIKEPFYGFFLIALNKHWSDKIPTACVGLNGLSYELIISPSFWSSLEEKKYIGLIKHELMHIALFHLCNYDSYRKQNAELLNIAMDLEINQYIDRDSLPEGGVFLDKFSHLNLEPKKGTIYYYEELSKAQDLIKALGTLTQENNKITLGNGETIELPDHDWEVFDELDDATKKIVQRQTEHIVKEILEQAKSQGHTPGEIKEVLDRIQKLRAPIFDWKAYVRRFKSNSIKVYTKKSRRKYNKRVPDNPGLKLKKLKTILAAIDVSGSVSTNELKEFQNEMFHLSRSGSEVILLQYDTTITSIKKLDINKPIHIHGRGGTNFQPVIDYYRENLDKYSCLINFTDGGASIPENAKGNILWVISSSGYKSEFPGKIIQIEKPLDENE